MRRRPKDRARELLELGLEDYESDITLAYESNPYYYYGTWAEGWEQEWLDDCCSDAPPYYAEDR